MSQFGYCVSNQNYNDVGTMDGCNDTYASLSGMDSCAMAGMQEYQQGMMAATPSFCNQTSDYAPVRGMYGAVEVPAIARLQYHAPITQLYDNTYVNPLMTVQGQPISVRPGASNKTIQQYQQYAADAIARGQQAAIDSLNALDASTKTAKAKEAFHFYETANAIINTAQSSRIQQGLGAAMS